MSTIQSVCCWKTSSHCASVQRSELLSDFSNASVWILDFCLLTFQAVSFSEWVVVFVGFLCLTKEYLLLLKLEAVCFEGLWEPIYSVMTVVKLNYSLSFGLIS